MFVYAPALVILSYYTQNRSKVVCTYCGKHPPTLLWQISANNEL